MIRRYFQFLLVLFFLLSLFSISKAQVGGNIGSDFEEINEGRTVRRKTSIVCDGAICPPRQFNPGVKIIGFKVRKATASTVIGIETPDDNGYTASGATWDVVKDDGGSIQFTVSQQNWYASPRFDRLPTLWRFSTNQSAGTLTLIELEWDEYVSWRRRYTETIPY